MRSIRHLRLGISKRARGTTLLELLVALIAMAIIAGFVSALMPRHQSKPAEDSTRVLIERARNAAISLRKPVTVVLHKTDTIASLTAWPDGSTSADNVAHVNAFNGVERDSAR